MAHSPAPAVLDTILLKVASRCNLDCGYCYVYHMGDDAWRSQPKRMSEATGHVIAMQLGEVYRAQNVPFSVVLHGGEPLLLGKEGLASLLEALRSQLPNPNGIHVQTNGILLTDPITDLLVKYDVGISISIDGPSEVHDRFRVDHKGSGSFQRVMAAIERLQARSDARHLFAGVLAVVDPSSDPAKVYAALKSTGAPSLDVLVRDGNWDRLPFGKTSASSTEYGEWLAALLDIYLADRNPPRLRLFDDMLRLLLGGQSQKEGVGTTDYGILIVEPDGRINKNDTLKVAHAGADRFEAEWTVHSHRLTEVLSSDAYNDYHRQQQPTASACQTCPELGICGGGITAHRWSKEQGYDNPTVFCADQKHLIASMRGYLENKTSAPWKDVA